MASRQHARQPSHISHASIAVAVPAPEHKARATEPWVATGATGFFEDHGILSGAEFDISAKVVCNGAASNGSACSWRDTQPEYAAVYAYTDYDTLVVTTRHQWLAADGVRRVSSAVGTLPGPPRYEVPLDPFKLQVSDGVAELPGLIGHFGTWSATDGDFLSAPAGYALDAPGFDISCFYDYNPDSTVYAACTPSGTIAAGSQVSLWDSVLYNITTVQHEWTAADGTKFQLVGTSAALPNLGQVTEFTMNRMF
ncbi:hypothetical protein F5B21DRAFT_511107 [Xylaria acuta]|nr:hypothetical protein F5B21DRAFT_511107 [Xylaria acuta]